MEAMTIHDQEIYVQNLRKRLAVLRERKTDLEDQLKRVDREIEQIIGTPPSKWGMLQVAVYDVAQAKRRQGSAKFALLVAGVAIFLLACAIAGLLVDVSDKAPPKYGTVEIGFGSPVHVVTYQHTDGHQFVVAGSPAYGIGILHHPACPMCIGVQAIPETLPPPIEVQKQDQVELESTK
jgi:hypothetical protein